MWPVDPIIVDADKVTGNRIVIERYDPIFLTVVWALIIASVVAVVSGGVTVVLLTAGRSVGIPLGILIVDVVLGVLVAFSLPMFRRIPPDMMATRGLISNARYFTDCPVFAPWFVLLTLFEGSQQIVKTGEKAGDEHLITVQLRQGANPSMVTGQANEQIVQVVATFHLDIWEAPEGVMRAYQKEFSANGSEAFKTMVKPFVLDAIVANADTPLQAHSVDECLDDVGTVNDDLAAGLKDPLAHIAVHMLTVAIEKVLDIGTGAVAYRKVAVEAELKKAATVRAAEAKRDALLAQYEARLAAENRRIATELEIEQNKKGLIVQQVTNQRERAKIGIQDLVARTRFLASKNAWFGTLISALERTPDDKVIEVANAIAEGLKSMGLRPNGSLLLVNSGDSDGGVEMAKVATGVGMAIALLKDSGLIPKDFQLPATFGQPNAPGTNPTP